MKTTLNCLALAGRVEEGGKDSYAPGYISALFQFSSIYLENFRNLPLFSFYFAREKFRTLCPFETPL